METTMRKSSLGCWILYAVTAAAWLCPIAVESFSSWPRRFQTQPRGTSTKHVIKLDDQTIGDADVPRQSSPSPFQFSLLTAGLIFMNASPCMALEYEQRGWDLYTIITPPTTPSSGMFAPPDWRTRQARADLKRLQDLQDQQLAMCVDRGDMWENCFWYGIRDGNTAANLIAPPSDNREAKTSPIPKTPTKPPTW